MFPGLSASVRAELGTTDDPRALIPGNPDAILAKLATVTTLSAGIDEASSAFTTIDEESWQGAAGDSFRQAFSQEVRCWHDSAAAFDAARTALQNHAHTLQAAQNQAADAIEQFHRAAQATKTAQAQHDAQQDNTHTAAVPPITPFSDPGAADRQEAQAKLDDARRKVKNSGDNAARAVGVQRDSAPQGPGPLERAWAAVTETGASLLGAEWHAATGAAGAVADMAKPLAALNPIAAFTHPMSAVSNVADMATGLLHAANHPVQVGEGMVDVDDWGKDPAAAIGKTAVNVGSLLAGGGGAAKGAEAGAEGASLARAAGAAEKATTTAADAVDHMPLKPADWAPPLPPGDTRFGPQGSRSLLHDPAPADNPTAGLGPPSSTHTTPSGHQVALRGDLRDPAPADYSSVGHDAGDLSGHRPGELHDTAPQAVHDPSGDEPGAAGDQPGAHAMGNGIGGQGGGLHHAPVGDAPAREGDFGPVHEAPAAPHAQPVHTPNWDDPLGHLPQGTEVSQIGIEHSIAEQFGDGEVKWRADHDPLYRQDDRPPSRIFGDHRQGFVARNTSFDLHQHLDTAHGGAVSTTRDLGFAIDRASTRVEGSDLGYVYEIHAPGGLDVSKMTVGESDVLLGDPAESEVAFVRQIDPQYIKRALVIDKRTCEVIESHANPNFWGGQV